MMIAVSSTGPTPEAFVSEKFGRCSYFILYDNESKTVRIISNNAGNLEHGAGPKAAQLIINENAEVVLTGAVGGNAGEVLRKGGIKVITGIKNNMKVNEVIDLFLKSKLN
jgi:predicted Fe-Mo cluster-binding NifX family protein